MAIGRGSGLEVDERTDNSRGTNDDIIATHITWRAESITRTLNIWDQREKQSGDRAAWKLN